MALNGDDDDDGDMLVAFGRAESINLNDILIWTKYSSFNAQSAIRDQELNVLAHATGQSEWKLLVEHLVLHLEFPQQFCIFRQHYVPN